MFPQTWDARWHDILVIFRNKLVMLTSGSIFAFTPSSCYDGNKQRKSFSQIMLFFVLWVLSTTKVVVFRIANVGYSLTNDACCDCLFLITFSILFSLHTFFMSSYMKIIHLICHFMLVMSNATLCWSWVWCFFWK